MNRTQHQLTGEIVLSVIGPDHTPQVKIDGALSARDFGVSRVGQPEQVEPELQLYQCEYEMIAIPSM